MATYVYETIPADASRPARRFEVRQSMRDAPLARDPETGEPVRRVITGGYGFVGGAKDAAAPDATPARSHGGGCGHSGCGCAH